MDNQTKLLEVCADNLQSVENAINGGAKRIELCSSLSEGGLTPSIGFMIEAKKVAGSKLPIVALIRPRGGDFCYSQQEVNIMCKDLIELQKAGADGFVLGCLTSDGKIDSVSCKKMISQISHLKNLTLTFHRAFDMAVNPKEAIKEICSLGFHRLLTSGQEKSAYLGINCIKELHQEFGDEIIIMAGGGINSNNIMEIWNMTKINEFHASARKEIPSLMRFQNQKCAMGTNSKEYSLQVTSDKEVKAIVDCFQQMK